MARREWTGHEEELLRLWRMADVKVLVIARRLVRTPGSVKLKLHRLRLIIRPDIVTRRRSGQLARAVERRLRAGLSVVETATELGVDHGAVSRVRKRLAIPPRSRSERVSLSWVFRRARGDKPPNRWAKRVIA